MPAPVLEAYTEALHLLGNPASTHAHGQFASEQLEAARERIARRLGAHPALVTLGRWSFAIYMVHMFLLTVMMIIARKLHWMPGGRRIDFGSVWINDLFTVGMFGLVVVVAVAAHRLVERPAQRQIDRWTAVPKQGVG